MPEAAEDLKHLGACLAFGRGPSRQGKESGPEEFGALKTTS
jgi:hypothetical protein